MKSFKQFFLENYNEQLNEKLAWSHKTYDDYVAHNKAKGLQVIPKDLWHNLKKNPNQPSIKKEEVELDEAKLDRQTHTVGAHHLQRDSGDHKMYTSYIGSQVRRLHTVTDKDDNILGQGMSAASAMTKAKLKKAHRDALMHDDNQIIKVHDTRGKHNVGTQVATPGKGKWFKDHDEAMKYAKSLPGKIRHADEKGHVYSESVKIDEAKKPKPGHNAMVLSKNISKVLGAVKKEDVELEEASNLRITKIYHKKNATYAVHSPDRKYFKEFDNEADAKKHLESKKS